MIQRKSPYRTPSNPYGCKNQAGFLRQAQSSALREEVASISVFASAWILASAHILDRPCSNYAGNLSHGEPSANPQRKTVVYWYLWGLFPIFVLGPPRPTNNSHDLKSTSVMTVYSLSPGVGSHSTEKPQLAAQVSDFAAGTKNLARLFPPTLLPIQKRSTRMSWRPTNTSPMKLTPRVKRTSRKPKNAAAGCRLSTEAEQKKLDVNPARAAIFGIQVPESRRIEIELSQMRRYAIRRDKEI